MIGCPVSRGAAPQTFFAVNRAPVTLELELRARMRWNFDNRFQIADLDNTDRSEGTR
jgi:hypothetical protein